MPALATLAHTTSAIVALVVALLNLLVAGYTVTTARERSLRDPSRVAFAAGPAGVGVWALAWFVSLFDEASLDGARALGTAGGLVAITGFAVDALLSLDRRRALRIAAGALAATIAIVGLVAALAARSHEVFGFTFVARVASLAGVGATIVAHGYAWTSARDDERRLARSVLFTSLGTVVFCGVLALAAFLGDRTIVDPLLLVVLLAELWALVYILQHRVEVRLLLSHSLTYVLLSSVVALVAAGVFRVLGYAPDPVAIAVTVMIALLASALFMGTSTRLTSHVERLLFPEQARLQQALATSRGELSALRRRLERAEKLAIAGELAASVAHEIKNPLAPIRGYAQLLEGRLGSVDERERAMFTKGLAIIREETDRIDRRIAELLAAARAERATASVEDTADLNRVVIEAVLVASGEAGRIRVEQHLDPKLGRVVGNEDELRGAISNLLKNAIEAMQGTDGRVVDVVTRLEEARAIVEVVDEGPGLAPRDAERVFDAFYTTKQGGTGLGLAIARSAVEAAGGTISLEDRGTARGAIARIALDVAAPARSSAAAHA